MGLSSWSLRKDEMNLSLLRMFPGCFMFVEVRNGSDTTYNLVHPKRKTVAVQEDFFELGCKLCRTDFL